jgi:hypothetical protein
MECKFRLTERGFIPDIFEQNIQRLKKLNIHIIGVGLLHYSQEMRKHLTLQKEANNEKRWIKKHLTNINKTYSKTAASFWSPQINISVIARITSITKAWLFSVILSFFTRTPCRYLNLGNKIF